MIHPILECRSKEHSCAEDVATVRITDRRPRQEARARIAESSIAFARRFSVNSKVRFRRSFESIRAAQLWLAADAVPFAGPALPRLVRRKIRASWLRRVKAPRG